MTISLCTFLRAISYGVLLPFYICGTELRRSLRRQGLQPVVLALALSKYRRKALLAALAACWGEAL